MKIAVTYENETGNVFQHFGHTEYFKFYKIEDGKVTESKVVSAEGFGHESLADFLLREQVVALVCGGIGYGAQMALSMCGIQLFAGISGNADAAINALLAGTLTYSTSANCNHHDGEHHEGGCHDGGEGGCGHHCGQ